LKKYDTIDWYHHIALIAVEKERVHLCNGRGGEFADGLMGVMTLFHPLHMNQARK
jgi:hypothetical protein